ncbi:MerR family transcriptional regulator [Myceligenerans pegani]|uniref:MerR family transcriptional regulator n=1 Tax=Myceligenerans pegani TaxID=2776917 RepID=A0ABR9MSI7_9MICO|nr:MerR family transcriptional regulator [Myceligenerans sp. TRM 65318]MBE1874337.1 MerR family transcriptional regulator [Myceligenerans sp. TRM 65318]MBE3016608.1 MerR family transcriptional regulator [Myceligenerans sp. TRM 65318]
MTSTRPAQSQGGPRPSSPGLAVAAVAKRLGVAPATLRTWDRRYGLGPSGRTAGSHRRYTPDDVARLLVMRRLTLEGHAPGDAARAAIEASDEELATVQSDESEEFSQGGGMSSDPAAEGESDGAGGDPDAELGPGAPAPGTGGPTSSATGPASDGRGHPEHEGSRRGHLRALPGGGGTQREPGRPRTVGGTSWSSRVSALVDAAIKYSRTACDALLRLSPEDDPSVWWTELVEPAFDQVAVRTVLAGPGEVPEMVLAAAALASLRAYTEEFEREVVEAGGPPANHPSRMRKIVLVFAAPDELVPLPAHALAASLAAKGTMARIVTGPASTHRSVELVTMVRPAAVVLATTQTRPALDVVHAVHEAYPDLPLLVGMRADAAAGDVPLGPTVQRVRSFNGLLHEVLAVLR